ncbi:MAG: V-type ATP synthase subunit I [Intestinimonas sp.]|jgi:V/A-type H+-transporting ATPase subunit I|nr:V-type ATP synthase subunit I [Intestinimonas sp.]
MAIVKMKRLRLFAMTADRDALLRGLQHLGCVEIDEPTDKLADPQWAALTHRAEDRSGETEARHTALAAALAALDEYAPVKTSLFTPRRAVTERQLFDPDAQAEAEAAAQVIGKAVKAISAVDSEQSRLRGQKAALAPWLELDVPLDATELRDVSLIFGTMPVTASEEEASTALSEATDLAELTPAGKDQEQQYLLLLCHRSAEDEALEALKKFGFSKAALRGWTGTARENTDALNARLAELDRQRASEVETIVGQSAQRDGLKLTLDQLSQQTAREAAVTSLLDTEETFFLEGWVTAPDSGKVERLLKNYTCAWEMTEPETAAENIPVKLKSNKLTYPLNMVTEMYSLPAYDGIDPNPLILPFFPIFFGIMYADLGYGIILIVLGVLALKYCHFRGAMDQMMRLMVMCGITTAVMGFAFGGFFGDVLKVIYESFLNVPEAQFPAWLSWFNSGPLINPLSDPMTVMIGALVLGGIQIIVGMIIHLYMEIRDGQALDGILDVVPWWLLFAGLGLGAVKSTWTLALVGVVALVLTQGRHQKSIVGKFVGGLASLYDITSYLSDILSYLRLMALLLATSVIASVVNTLGAMTGIIGFIIIFLVGHAFNMGINIIGTYVHAARLQYLEFFSKFYKEGGRPFAPLKIDTQYVDVIKEEN